MPCAWYTSKHWLLLCKSCQSVLSYWYVQSSSESKWFLITVSFILLLTSWILGACPTLCNGNGNYIRGQCQCHHGWKGQECDIREDECEVPNCNGNGRCVDGKCVCHTGFKGLDCGEGMWKFEHLDVLHIHCSAVI